MDRGGAKRNYPGESASFWVALLAGSVAFHTLVLVLVVRFLPRPTPPVPESTIPVELVDLDPVPAPTGPTSARQGPIATPPRTSPQAPPPEATDSPAPSPQLEPEPAPTPPPQPIATPPVQQPRQRRSPSPPLPQRSPGPTPGAGTSPTAGGEEPGLPGVGVATNPVPAQLRVTVAIARTDQDVASRPARPKTLTQVLEAGTTDCNPTPESNRFLGTTVELLVEVDPQGQVVPEQTLVQQPIDPAYDELAICLVNQWEFIPAADRQLDTWIPRRDSFRIKVTISRLNPDPNQN